MTLAGGIRYALKGFLKKPTTFLAATLSITLGIGVTSAIFSMASEVLLHPIGGVEDPSRLVAIFTTDEDNQGYFLSSYPNSRDYRDRIEGLSGLAAHTWVQLAVEGGGRPDLLHGQAVSKSYFEILGVDASLGRVFHDEDERQAPTDSVVVLSHRLWKGRYGSDPSVVGETVVLNGHPLTVLGVADPAFTGTEIGRYPELWVPMPMYDRLFPGTGDLLEDRRTLRFGLAGRLASGATLGQVAQSADAVSVRLAETFPQANEGRGVTPIPLAEAALNPNIHGGAVLATELLFGVAGLVLLVACANVANIQMSRAAERRQDIAVRLALGSSRGRVVRQLLLEGLIVALLGGAGGLFLAAVIPELVLSMLPSLPFPVAFDFGVDGWVLAFTLVLSAVSALLFGLAPALQALKTDQVTALKEQGRGGAPAGRQRLRKSVVVFQVGFSLTVLIVASLFVRSVHSASDVDPGIAADELAVMTLDPGLLGHEDARAEQLCERVLRSVRAMPGVAKAELAAYPPFVGGFNRTVSPEGVAADEEVLVPTNVVGPVYFDVVGIPILKGRSFTRFDRGEEPHVAVVNETMADRFWPGEAAVGRRFSLYGFDEPVEVVGVARDAKYSSLSEEPTPYAYLPRGQMETDSMVLYVRARGDPAALLPHLRREVQAAVPSLPLIGITTVSELLDRTLWTARLGAQLLSAFGLLAVVLAALGLFGLMSYSVANKTREIGLHMAMGAGRGEVFRLVLRQGMGLVLVGLSIGLIAGLAVARGVSSLLYGVRVVDLPALGLSAAVLLAVVFLALFVPAQRAANLDPMRALRST